MYRKSNNWNKTFLKYLLSQIFKTDKDVYSDLKYLRIYEFYDINTYKIKENNTKILIF